ncbi:MAG: aminotransferase class V-fold PLP-dependent enzyme [Candidatus Woesearchaeota archaeon]
MFSKNQIKEIRRDFPVFKKNVFLDSAASSQKPKPILKELKRFHEEDYANIHRGIYELSEKSTEFYDKSREKVSEFISCNENEIVFTKNTTESMNLISDSLIRHIIKNNISKKIKPKILISVVEHHSNIVPWFIAKDRYDIEVDYISLDKENQLNLKEFKEKVKSADIVSLTGASNVLGNHTSYELFKIAKENNAFTIMDGAQLIPHTDFSINENIDFLTFSGHKMLSETGIGVLYGKEDLLEQIPPFLGGGDMIKEVNMNNFTPADVPQKFEAGTMPFAQAYSLGLAIDYLNDLGMSSVQNHVKELSEYAYKLLSKLDKIKIISSPESHALISFTHDKYHPHDVAYFLSKNNISVRAGHHCAEPLHTELGLDGSVRASFYLYNNKEDVKKLYETLKRL